MSGFVTNELSAFCGGGKSAEGVARSRFPAPAALWRTPSGGLFHLLYDRLALGVIGGELARTVK